MSHSFLSYFSYFKQEVGNKLYLLLLLSICASFLDGLGITALLPLISLDFSGEPANDIFSQFFFSFFHLFNLDPTVSGVLILILGIFFLRLLFNFTQMGVSSYISTWLSEHLKRKYAKAYNRMDYAYYISTNIGYFNNIITTESGTVVVCFKRISEIVVSGSNMVAYLFFSFFKIGRAHV